LRILVLTNMWPDEARPSFGIFVSEQVAALRRIPSVERVDVMFVDGDRSAWNYARGGGRLHRAVRRGSYDVVHAHWGLTGAVAVTQRRLPVVITFHGSDLAVKRWHRLVSRTAARFSAANICVSRAGLAFLGRPGEHIPCGVDRTVFRPLDRSAARRDFDVPDDALALMFPGPPARKVKGYSRFEEVRDALIARVTNVHELRLDGIARADVPRLMAATDVIAMTSLSEGSPMAVMEALACGVPIVATDVVDVRRMLDGARRAFVAPFSVNEFTAAVMDLAGESGPREPDPRAEEFDLSETTRRTLEVLEAAAKVRTG